MTKLVSYYLQEEKKCVSLRNNVSIVIHKGLKLLPDSVFVENSRDRKIWLVNILKVARFLAVQNSSIGDLVTHSLTEPLLIFDIK